MEGDNESEDSTKKNTLAMVAEDHDKLTKDDDSRSYVIDREAEVNEENRLWMRPPTFSDARVIAFIKDNNIDPKDYASFHKSMKIPKVKKHLTPEQSHHIFQSVSIVFVFFVMYTIFLFFLLSFLIMLCFCCTCIISFMVDSTRLASNQWNFFYFLARKKR